MHRWIALLAFALLLPAAQAAPASEASVRELLEVMHASQMIDGIRQAMRAGMQKGIEESVKGKHLDEDQRRAIEALPARMSEVMEQEMSWESLQPLYIQVYRDTYTQEEVDGLVAFFRTPVGQGYIEKMPQAMQRSQAAMAPLIPRLVQRMNEAMARSLAEILESKKNAAEGRKGT